jgi:putative DNA primase/helicase
MLVGPKRSGKGTIARVARKLIGEETVCGPTPSSLSMNFGLWPLLGKTAAIISDARLSGRTDAATVTERLLSISGEDALTIDRKHLPPVTTKLATRFMILTNELPRLGDASGALTGRMILLRPTESWYGREDIKLTDRLLDELPGILAWAIVGWQRLRERGHFVQPEDGREMLEELDNLSSPVGAFVVEKCLVEPCARVSIDMIFEAWKSWCLINGKREPGTIQTFGRDLRAAVPSIKRNRPRDDEGSRYRGYEGIGLK